MNPSQRNCNPLNLRFSGQTEATGQSEQGFAVFPTPMAGWRAAHAQLKLDQSRGLTVGEEIYKWAPPIENDTPAYLKFVCRELWVTSDTPLTEVSVYALAGVMANMEGYYNKE